jgi:hypothetical protein
MIAIGMRLLRVCVQGWRSWKYSKPAGPLMDFRQSNQCQRPRFLKIARTTQVTN